MSGSHHDHAGHAGHDHAHGGSHGGHDAWHHHDAAEGAPQAEHGSVTNISTLFRGLMLIVVSTLGLVGITMLYLNSHINQLRRERGDVDLSSEVVEYHEAANKRLNGYGWVDATTPHVPLNTARERVLKRYEAGAPK